MRVRRHRRAGTALACVAAALALAACGGGSDGGAAKSKGAAKSDGTAADAKPADAATPTAKDNGVAALSGTEALKRARAAFLAAAAVRVKGTTRSDGDTGTLDSRLAKDGSCAGTIGLGSDGRMDVVEIGPDVWLRPDAKAAKSLVVKGGKPAKPGVWLHGDKKNLLLVMAGFACNREGFAGAGFDETSTVTKRGKETLDGRPAIALEVKTDKERNLVHVATTGEPVPLKVESFTSSGGGSDGSIVYTEYGKPFNATPPPAAQTDEAGTLEDSLNSDG